MELVYATGEELENGWVLSVKFLESIQTLTEKRIQDDEIPSLKQIEAALIAFQTLTKEPGIRLVHMMADDKDTY